MVVTALCCKRDGCYAINIYKYKLDLQSVVGGNAVQISD